MSAPADAEVKPLPLPAAGLAGQLSFSLYWAHHFPAPPGWTVPPPRRRPYATLWLVLAGELQVRADAGPCAAGPGALVAWPPDADRWAVN